MTSEIPLRRWSERDGVPRSRPVAVALLLAFSACARSSLLQPESVNGFGSTSGASSHPTPIAPIPLNSGVGGETQGTGVAAANSFPGPAVAQAGAAPGDTSFYYLVVIGPPEKFWNLATTPSDPEVVYLEEASEIGRDGRREKVVIAMTKAAVRRFKAAAKKLGMEVRSIGEH